MFPCRGTACQVLRGSRDHSISVASSPRSHPFACAEAKAPPLDLEMHTGRPAVLVAWFECATCGRIEKPAHEFEYPADLAEGTQLFVWYPCERCGRQAKLHIRREIKPAH
jgi:hypothetical protein